MNKMAKLTLTTNGKNMSYVEDPKDQSFALQVKSITYMSLKKQETDNTNYMISLIKTAINTNKGRIISAAELGTFSTVIYKTQDKEICSIIRSNIDSIRGSYGFEYKYGVNRHMTWMGLSSSDGCNIEICWE